MAAIKTLGCLPHIALSKYVLCKKCTPFLEHVHAEVQSLAGMFASCSEVITAHVCIV